MIGMTKMKIKRILVSAVAAAFASVSLFAGCTQEPTAKETSEKTSAVSRVSDVSDTSSDSSEKDESSETQSSSESSYEEESNTSTENSDESSEEEPKVSNITPAVWEVTDQNGNNIYMMGSIHLADENASVLPDYFETAYAKCDALAVECDITQSSDALTSLMAYMYNDGTSIKDHVPEETYKKAVDTLKKGGMYSPTFDMMKPIMWVEIGEILAAQKSGLASEYGVDLNLLNRAKSENKEILEIESLDFQNHLLSNMDEDIQLILFEELADENYIEDGIEQIKSLYDNWKKGDISEDLTDEESEDSDTDPEKEELIKRYNALMLDDRNVGMAEAAEEYMLDGKKVMVVVGAAHFYGENGILSLLEKDGCTVRKLTAEDAQNVSKPEESAESSEEVSKTPSIPLETDPGIARAA